MPYSDVVDAEGNVRSEVVLRAENTKTKEARTVFVNAKLKKELQSYISSYKPTNPNAKLFYSHKVTSNGYNANTLNPWMWLRLSESIPKNCMIGLRGDLYPKAYSNQFYLRVSVYSSIPCRGKSFESSMKKIIGISISLLMVGLP